MSVLQYSPLWLYKKVEPLAKSMTHGATKDYYYQRDQRELVQTTDKKANQRGASETITLVYDDQPDEGHQW